MKQVGDWFYPDREKHLPEWMATHGSAVIMNGRATYQGRKQRAAFALCTAYRTAIDVGAHIGLWSYNLAMTFGVVRAFEPMQEHRECFAFNVPQENVIVYPMCLGNYSGRIGMQTNASSTGDTFVVPGGEDTRIEPLDSFDFSEVDFIKIDCEGYEEEVLRGAADTIKRWRPVICVEQKRDFPVKYGLKPQGAVGYLNGLGYVVVQEIAGDYIMKHGDA